MKRYADIDVINMDVEIFTCIRRYRYINIDMFISKKFNIPSPVYMIYKFRNRFCNCEYRDNDIDRRRIIRVGIFISVCIHIICVYPFVTIPTCTSLP